MNMTEEKAGAGMKIQAVLIDGYKNLSNVKISFDNIFFFLYRIGCFGNAMRCSSLMQ